MQPLNENLYLSSIICSASIFLQSFSNANVIKREPYFLRQYSITRDRESVKKDLALVKVSAVSMNPNALMPVGYTILNSAFSDLFIIDSTQGFIYPRYDLALAPKIYIVKVKATDPSNGQYSLTDVHINIIYKMGNKLTCNKDYIYLKINPDGIFYLYNLSLQ